MEEIRILCRKCLQYKQPSQTKKGWTKSTLKGICKKCNNINTKHYKLNKHTIPKKEEKEINSTKTSTLFTNTITYTRTTY